MKKSKLFITSSLTLLLLCSCASTPEPEQGSKSENHKSHSEKTSAAVQETPEDKFIKSLEGILITNTDTPKEVESGKSFAKPFTFQITSSDGTPVSDFAVTISYPASKSDNTINFATTDLRTDENGNVSFTPDKTSFAVKTKLTAYPTPDTDSETLLERVKKFSVSADWAVKSDIKSKGAALFVWDFNEKGRPENNSYNIQAEFRSRGITNVGNGPVNESSYIGNTKALYKDTYEIIQTSVYGYLIYGTIKYETPVTANEDGNGYYCVLKAEIGILNMKDGSQVYSSEISHKAEGKNWTECVSKAKDKLSELVVDDIMYGL